ncbi:LysR substrate-binding domain-containing protein [Paraburkholderia sp.]|uniref:LysR substrate-binding domain-containing protein n=1 Tax=Paraburkholderia sp. TaxID=1926495 RepID=UPI002D4F949E|nr:LysR substrate-binding domain-containing protein [Paraburkholderia sp.]HZZ06773.1 LysR substrate-binding domain-containing protein [Paraburkholderia sp.]
MDLRHLRYFLAAAEEGHFGRAARRLNIVQPALSMQIRALEAELGGPLFLRTSRRVELTEAGMLLREEARRTLDQAEHTRLTVQRAIRGETGNVRVGFAGNAVFSGKLIDDLRAFHRTYPDADLVVRELAPQLQADAIVAGQVDIGYTPDPGLARDGRLTYEPIGTWRILAALPSDHELASKKRLTARMLTKAPLILYAAHEADESLVRALREVLDRPPKVVYQAANTLSVLALVAAGLGLALVPAPIAQITLPGVVYRPLDLPGLTMDLMRISRADESSGAVRAFMTLARRRDKSSRTGD